MGWNRESCVRWCDESRFVLVSIVVVVGSVVSLVVGDKVGVVVNA